MLNNPMMITNLRCELLNNPQGIDVVHPALSWMQNDDRRGAAQSAYRILVASSPALLAEDNGDLWDSAKVASDQSALVEYAGATLTARQQCYWKVQAWDENDLAMEWSETAHWSMGLLEGFDASAKWISIDRKDRPLDSHDSPMLRKTFSLSGDVQSAQVSVCGLGYYELFLDGAKVGDHVLDPTWTTYDQSALYVTYDIAAALSTGDHAFGVQLANGVYNQEHKDAWNYQNVSWRAFPQLLLQVDVVYTDGRRERIVSDESWRAAEGPITWDQLRMGVVYDARREQPGWATAAFDDSAWQAAILREGPGGALSAQMCEPIKVIDTLEAVSIVESEPGEFTVDFGQNISGWVQLTVDGPAGTEVTIEYDQCGGRNCISGKPFQTDVYILRGGGEEVWEPHFTYHGFKTVTVRGFPGTLDKSNIVARVVHTAFVERGAFECSQPLLNAFVHMSRWSYKGNFVGIPTDCPHREKNGWTADAHIATELGLCYFGPETAYARWILDHQASQRDDGKVPCIIPPGGDGWGHGFLDGPAWESSYLIIPWHLYEYVGDRRTLARYYDDWKRWIGWYRDKHRICKCATDYPKGNGLEEEGTRYTDPMQVNQDDIVCYGIGDWPPNGTTPFEITSTAYIFRSAQIIAEVANMLGNDDDANEYTELAARTKAAFNREFFDAEAEMYKCTSQTGLACALFFGLVEAQHVPRVVARLVQAIKDNNDKPLVGCLGSKYLLRVLADHGEIETAYRMMTNPESPGWGYLAASDHTTLPECMDGSGSNNHVFLGDGAAWMMQYLAGIRHDPDHPGFQRFIIKPHVAGDLTWVNAHHDSPYGRIESAWTRDGDTFTLNLTVPPNSTATVLLPDQSDAILLQSGRHTVECKLG